MNLTDALHLMPSRADPELVTVDESEINERVSARASEILADAYADHEKAYDLIDDCGDAVETLADLIPLIGALREESAALTHAERIERFMYRADKLIREYATNAAELERESIERAWCREQFEGA